MKAQSLQFLAAATSSLISGKLLAAAAPNRSSACVLPPRFAGQGQKALQQLFQRLLTVEGGTRRREGTARRVRAALRSTSAISSHRFTTSHRRACPGSHARCFRGTIDDDPIASASAARVLTMARSCSKILERIGNMSASHFDRYAPKAILPLQFFRWRVVSTTTRRSMSLSRVASRAPASRTGSPAAA